MATTGVKIAGTKLVLQGAEDFISGLAKAAQAQADFNAQIAKGVDIKLDTTKLTQQAEQLKSVFEVPGLMKFPAPELDNTQWNRVAEILKDTSTEAVDFQEKFTQAVKIAQSESQKLGGIAAITAEQLSKMGTAMLALGTASATMLIGFVMVASRIEELSRILDVTAHNAADLAIEEAMVAQVNRDFTEQEHRLADAALLTSGAVQEEVESVRQLHLSGVVATEAVAQMIRYDLDWTRASELAREAQDAATYAMQDSSVAMNGLIQGIITLQPRLLRTYGIMINLDIAYEKFSKANNIAVKEMTVTQRQQAALNEVLAKAPTIAGAYEAAMKTGAKQIRSFKTDSVDFAEAMGKSVTPALDAAVGGIRRILRAVIEMPAPIRDTVVQMGALGSASLLLIGGLTKLVPLIAGLSAATLGWGIALATIGAGIGYLVYLDNLDKAHRAEAAAVAASSSTYEEYKQRLEWAKLASYNLTEQLWNQVEAQKAVNQEEMAKGLLEAQKKLEGLASIYSKFIKTGGFGGINEDTKAMFTTLIENGNLAGLSLTEFDKIVLSDKESVIAWGRELGIAEDKLPGWVAKIQANLEVITAHDKAVILGSNAIKKFGDQAEGAAIAVDGYGLSLQDLAKNANMSVEQVEFLKDVVGLTDDEILSYADSLDMTNQELWDMSVATGVAYETLKTLHEELGGGKGRLEEYYAAIDRVTDAFSNFLRTLAHGIINLRDFAVEQKKAAKDYRDSMGQMYSDAAKKIDAINKKYDEMLPEKSVVEERAKGDADAWDEAARRMRAIFDGVQGDQEAGWVEVIKKFANEAGRLPQQAGESIQDYMRRIEKDFYAGKIPGLLNNQSAAWKAWNIDNEAARQKEIAETNAANAEEARIAAAKEVERLAAAKRAREEMLLQLQLQIADSTGELDRWAESIDPKMAGILGDADTVFALIESGMLPIPASLAQILADTSGSIATSLDQTGKSAEAAWAIVQGTQEQGKKDAEARKQAILDIQQQIADLIGGIPEGEVVPVDIAMQVRTLQGRLDELTTENAPLVSQLDTFGLTLAELALKFGGLETAGKAATDNLQLEFMELEQHIRFAWWQGSIFPQFNKEITIWGQQWKTTIDQTIIPAIQTVIDKLAEIPREIVVKVNIIDPPTPGRIIPPEQRIDEIIAAMGKIPEKITTDVQFTDMQGMLGALQGQKVAPQRLGSAITSIPNKAVNYNTAYVNGDTVSYGGDTNVSMQINDTASMALAMAYVKNMSRSRRNVLMGV